MTSSDELASPPKATTFHDALRGEVAADLEALFQGGGARTAPVRQAVYIPQPAAAKADRRSAWSSRDLGLVAAAAVGGLCFGLLAPRSPPASQRTAAPPTEAPVAFMALTPTDGARAGQAAVQATQAATRPAVPTAPRRAAEPPPVEGRGLRLAKFTAPAPPPAPAAAPADPTPSSLAPPPDATDCRDAPTLADEMVCEIPELAQAHGSLDRAYDAALAVAPSPEALRQDQQDWLAEREQVARRSTRALERFYRRRTDELWRYAETDVADDAPLARGPRW